MSCLFSYKQTNKQTKQAKKEKKRKEKKLFKIQLGELSKLSIFSFDTPSYSSFIWKCSLQNTKSLKLSGSTVLSFLIVLKGKRIIIMSSLFFKIRSAKRSY